jgi:CBS domain-containing protein
MIESVRDIMIKDLLTISENETALKAAQVMTEKGISSLIVLANDQPIGRIKSIKCKSQRYDVKNQNFCIT